MNQLFFEFESFAKARALFLDAAHFFSDFFGTTLLLSNEASEKNSSYLFLLPYHEIKIDSYAQDPWGLLKKALGPLNQTSDYPLWSGYLSYEMGAYQDPDFVIPHKEPPIPLARFQKCAILLIQENHQIRIDLKPHYQKSLLDQKISFSSFFQPDFWKNFFSMASRSPPSSSALFERIDLETIDSYCEKIKIAQEHIRSGNLYQINLSRSLYYQVKLSPFEIFKKLMHQNPVLFSAYLNFESFQILSVSPERFLSLKKGLLETRPIKGTLRRGKNTFEDQMQLNHLFNSSKESAELMMICDLMRNDLGRISQLGSIEVQHLKKVLTLSNVFHLESVITGRALKKHPLDLIRSCFPAGSITGCPKIRAMEIIYELEKRSRHIYCGSIGYFKANGDFDFNVAIRTALYQQNQLEIQLGGAITIDSDLEEEYRETLHKGAPFEKLLES